MKDLSVQKPFWFQIPVSNIFCLFRFVFSFSTGDRCTYVHNLLKPVGWLHPEQRWSKRAPDLAWFSRYSLFGPLHFSSSVYILACLYLSNFSTAAVSLQTKCWAVFDCTSEFAGSKQYFYLATKRRQKMTLLGYFSHWNFPSEDGFLSEQSEIQNTEDPRFPGDNLKVKSRTMQRVYDFGFAEKHRSSSQSQQNWRYRSLTRPWYLKNC